MHYIVTGKQREYCHNYFKLHKELPEGAFLNLNAEIQSDVTATSVLVQNVQPSTSKTGTPYYLFHYPPASKVSWRDVSEEQNQAVKRFNFKFFIGSFINDVT